MTALLDHVHIWLPCFMSFSWHLQMARWIVFTASGFWKYSWVHFVMSMTKSRRWVMQCCLRALKTTGIQQRYLALSLTHREFSSFSESFDDVMHCRWWYLQSLCNFTLRNVVFKEFHNLFTHFLRTLSQIGEPLPIFTSERLYLSKTLHSHLHLVI